MSTTYKYKGWTIRVNPNHHPYARFGGNCKSWLATPPDNFFVKFEQGITSYWGLAYMRKQTNRFIEMIEETNKNIKENENGNG